MLKVTSSKHLAELGGRLAPAPAAAPPAPAAPPAVPVPPVVDAKAMADLQRAMAAMASNVATLANAIAATRPEPPAQQLRATIIRDTDNRMSHLEVQIIR